MSSRNPVAFVTLLSAFVGAISLGVAWVEIGSVVGVVLGWVGTALFLVCGVRQGMTPRWIYLAGTFTIAIGFHWVPYAIDQISHLPMVLTAAISAVFILGFALQFPAYLFMRWILPESLDLWGIRCALAWTVIELIPVRLFPWAIGNTQSGFLALCQIADIGGVSALSFLILWVSEAALILLQERRVKPFLAAAAVLAATLSYGIRQTEVYAGLSGRSIDVVMVQGSAGHFPGRQTESPDILPILTNALDSMPDLVVWPEQALPFETHESVYVTHNDPRLPQLKKGITLLTGGLTHRNPDKTFNSMILIRPDGRIPLPYHKQDLIPLGEYIPLVQYFPFLQKLNPSAQGLSRGITRAIFEVASRSSAEPAKVAPLICYEDLNPLRSQEAVQAGADLLVVGSSDSWIRGWSETVLQQHSEMARFRAIETRRAVVRSTASGVSAIFDPSGAKVAVIPNYTLGIARSRVALLNVRTLHSYLAGYLLPILSVVSIALCFSRKVPVDGQQ